MGFFHEEVLQSISVLLICESTSFAFCYLVSFCLTTFYNLV